MRRHKTLVPGGGLEPPQGFWPLRILSPLRLPISPSRHKCILAHRPADARGLRRGLRRAIRSML